MRLAIGFPEEIKEDQGRKSYIDELTGDFRGLSYYHLHIQLALWPVSKSVSRDIFDTANHQQNCDGFCRLLHIHQIFQIVRVLHRQEKGSPNYEDSWASKPFPNGPKLGAISILQVLSCFKSRSVSPSEANDPQKLGSFSFHSI